MSTFITTLPTSGSGPRLAVKDLIDVEGVPTTAGCRALARTAEPAKADAPCLAGARSAGARIVGKANLQELAMGPVGTNPWFGTPVNPLDPALIPGGSSSGSAVAVADGDADVAYGSDTGGSVRIPSACCGTVGLKTTHGRIPIDGVWPLAPSLDTIGPMATTVDGVRLGMELLEPGFRAAGGPARRIGRLRTAADPALEAAVDAALAAAGLEAVAVDFDLAQGRALFGPIFFAEMSAVDGALVAANPDDVGSDVAHMVAAADQFRGAGPAVRAGLAPWRAALLALFDDVELLALPTLSIWPPRLDELASDPMGLALELVSLTSPFNAAGLPCTAQPVPAAGHRLPASLQLVGPPNAEELLLPTAALIEAAVA
ncbi:MAG TPA: amidase [Acidimicrobiia bacterium]|nr:amidase [Acidimicrobiia bacterium]